VGYAQVAHDELFGLAIRFFNFKGYHLGREAAF
jgi:hypothetical protein